MFNTLVILLMLFVPTTLTGSEGKAVVIFSNYKLDNTLFVNREFIRRVFTRKELRWKTGEAITVYIKPMDSIEHRNFVTNVLRMTMSRYKESLTASIASGTDTVHEVPNGSMVTAIHSKPGSIGYVNYDPITNEKIIKICDDNMGCE